jgi:hypothetical protein
MGGGGIPWGSSSRDLFFFSSLFSLLLFSLLYSTLLSSLLSEYKYTHHASPSFSTPSQRPRELQNFRPSTHPTVPYPIYRQACIASETAMSKVLCDRCGNEYNRFVPP